MSGLAGVFELELIRQRLDIKGKLAEANATLARAEELVHWVAHVILGQDLLDDPDKLFSRSALEHAQETEGRITRLQDALNRIEHPLSNLDHPGYASNPELAGQWAGRQ